MMRKYHVRFGGGLTEKCLQQLVGSLPYTVISYVVEAGEVSDKEEFLQTIKKLESINEEKVMTIVEQLKP
jgi:hypothetical protein